jgi:hypothetical protein
MATRTSRATLKSMSQEELRNHRKAIWRRYRDGEKYYNRRREREYQRRYGMSLEDYNNMLAAQHGVCAICKQVETSKGARGTKPLFVDHCHVTGKVRKLLCDNCNQVIGRAKDSIDILQGAIKYLKENHLGD